MPIRPLHEDSATAHVLVHCAAFPAGPLTWCQMVATVAVGTVQLGVQVWMFMYILEACVAQCDLFFVGLSAQQHRCVVYPTRCWGQQLIGSDGICCIGVMGWPKALVRAWVLMAFFRPVLQFSKGELVYGAWSALDAWDIIAQTHAQC